MDDDMKKFCPNCSQHYFIQFASSNVKGKWPLFLPCGHTMCENCIINVINCSEPLECKICFVDTEITKTESTELVQDKLKLHKKFPINLHMVGELTLNLVKASEVNKSNTPEEYFLDLKSLLKDDSAQAECLECHTTTTKICKQCAIVLCDACFNKTHKNFVIFKNHALQPIEATIPPNECKIHKEKKLEYYCKDCKKAICIDCMMVGEKSCKNHDVVALQEINETFLEDLNEISPQVDETFRRLTKTAVDIGYLLHNYENDTGSAHEISKIMADVDQHFSKLCSIVQKHKEEIMGIIKHLKSSERDSLQKAKSDVANAIKTARDVLNMISKASDKETLKQLNIPALLEEAKKVVETPWYLNKKETSKESLKVTVNEDLCSLINDYVQLEGNVKSIYKLCSASELGEDVDIPPAPTAPVYPPELPKDARQSNKPKVDKEDKKAPAMYKSVPKYRSKSGSISSVNSMSSDTSNKSYITPNTNYQPPIVHPVPPFAESQHPQQLRDGSQELIYISHIVDPYNFFVQRACFQGLVKDIVREFRNAGTFAKPSVNHITPGKTYLAFNEADNMWQRCRVTGIDTRNNKNNPTVQVFCFDFGSVEFVTVDKLRLLPSSKIQCPFPLAINCSLANCVPISGAWSSEDAILMQKIIDNKQAVIHIRRLIPLSNVDFKLECDVTTFETGVSIAHALVFHERAKMPNPRLVYPVLTDGRDKPKLYMSQNVFKPNTTEIVTITHVVNPDKFFVRKNHLQEVYEKLTEDLKQEYSVASNFGTVYLPEIGMVCAVNVEKYCPGSEVAWARGVVSELAGRGRVRVTLPDVGHALLVHWTALRLIRHKFTTLSALATECHLAGITPLNKKWTTASVKYLQRYEGKLLELKVEENRNRRGNRNHSSISVTLYDKENEDNVININNEMVKHKFAIAFGLYGFNKNHTEDQMLQKKSPQKTLSQPKKEKEVPKSVKNNSESDSSDNLTAKEKGPLRLEAKILHYDSPSHIYISLLQQQKNFNELFEAIQKYYSKNSKNKNISNEDWKVGDRCCSMCILSNTWRRAVILELDNDTAKLFYGDFACIESVPKTNLRVLTSEFAKIGDAALKCHLCGIMPALGNEWPLVTKECLKELLDFYKRVFITKIGNFKDNSMPIEIWVYHTVQGGALEPNTSEWRCLNNIIIDRGLGVPDKSQVVASSDNPDDLGDTLSFLNIKGSVNEWLQLEPMPMMSLKSLMKETSEGESNSDSPVSVKESDDHKTRSEESPECSNIMYITDWLPPEPLTDKEFTAIPTYVDNDGVIYLHDVSQQDILDVIRKALDVRFKNPDPKAKYTKWTVGEPCAALYYLDNRYYRGRVTEVNQENSNCLIHYIDYGNEELCSFANLRKSVPLHQIPTQAHRCILNRIRPVDEHWDRQTLDYIHKSIVEKKCRIKICGEPINGFYPIDLKIDKLWLNDHLVDFEMAEYTDGTKALIRKFAPSEDLRNDEQEDNETNVTTESDSGPDYIVVNESDTTVEQSSTTQDSFDHSLKGTDWNKVMEQEEASLEVNYISYPKDLQDEFMCDITFINDVNTLQLTIIFDEDTTRIYEQMFDELQTEGANMKPLNGIFENKACVAIFPEDGRWYRASILQFSETKNLLKVRYVDYGNTAVISLAETREISEEWVTLPPATISAKLHGVQLNPEVDITVVTEALAKTFLDQGPFHVKVISNIDSLPLVELKKDNEDLVYSKLIEDEIFIKCE